MAIRGEERRQEPPDQPQVRMVSNQVTTSRRAHKEAGTTHRQKTWKKHNKIPQSLARSEQMKTSIIAIQKTSRYSS